MIPKVGMLLEDKNSSEIVKVIGFINKKEDSEYTFFRDGEFKKVLKLMRPIYSKEDNLALVVNVDNPLQRYSVSSSEFSTYYTLYAIGNDVVNDLLEE